MYNPNPEFVRTSSAEGKLLVFGRLEVKVDGSFYLAGTEYYINYVGWTIDAHALCSTTGNALKMNS